MKSGTIFDNFVITDDVKEAEDIGNETWGVTKVCWFFIVPPARVSALMPFIYAATLILGARKENETGAR